MKNISLILTTLIFSLTFHFSYGQSENLIKISKSFTDMIKEKGGYSPLASWQFEAIDLPYTNEIYLHQGNQYYILAFQEYKNPQISFSLTKVFPDKSTKLLATSTMLGDSFQSMKIDAKNNTDGISYYLSLEQNRNSTYNTVVLIFYKSLSNETKDHSKNFAENHYTNAKQKNWADILYNTTRRLNPIKTKGIDKSTLTTAEVENTETKKIIWKGRVSDMYSISDNYVSYGLITKNNVITKDEITYVVEHMKTRKQYLIESEFPIFLKNDSLVFIPKSIEDYKERVGTVFNFKTNKEVHNDTYLSAQFSTYQSKSKNLEKALQKGFEFSGYQTIKKTGEKILWLGNGYYFKNLYSQTQHPKLYDANNQVVDLPEIALASFSNKLFGWVYKNPGRNWIGKERFFLPRFGRYTNTGYRYVVLTTDGYYEINTKTKESKPVSPKFNPVMINNKYPIDFIPLERDLLYISAYENGKSNRVRAVYDKKNQKFKYYGSKTAEEVTSLKRFNYMKVYKIGYSTYYNVLSPAHLRPRVADFD